jgi:hypothetical protein
MSNGRNLFSRGMKIVTVLVCMAVLMGAVGCASQTGEAPKKSGGGCLNLLRLFS